MKELLSYIKELDISNSDKLEDYIWHGQMKWDGNKNSLKEVLKYGE